MPVTIRPSVVKIKKPSTGEYREINALLDTDSAKTVYYGVSSTAASTQTKTVTIEGISALSDGLLVRILFANAQSYSGVPKLMINSTAASNIKTRRGTDATNLTWKAGDVLDFVYDSSSSGFIVLDKGDIEDLNGAISDTESDLIALSPSHNVAYTPSFAMDPNSPPTIDNIQFAYAKINPALLYIFGRFRLYSKNTTNTSTYLFLSLPTGFEISTGTTASLGVVYDTMGITNFILRSDTGTYKRLYFALGGGGQYSMQSLREGSDGYYSVTALVPTEF